MDFIVTKRIHSKVVLYENFRNIIEISNNFPVKVISTDKGPLKSESCYDVNFVVPGGNRVDIITTTSGVTSDDKVGILITHVFQCPYWCQKGDIPCQTG